MRYRSSRGFTIVELLVVIFCFAIIGAVVSEYTIQTFINESQLEGQNNTQTELNSAIEKISKIIRSCTEIDQADNNTLVIKGYPNTNDTIPSKITFAITSESLKFTVIPPTGTGPNYTYDPMNGKIYNLVTKLSNPALGQIFHYYGDNNMELTQPVSIGFIKMIEVVLTSQPDGPPAHLPKPITVSTKIELRNFKTNL